MKKCHWCGQTTNLKSAWCTGEDCLKGEYHDTSTCHKCWFETLGCNDCEMIIGECIKETDNWCNNHKENIFVDKNWDNLNYRYKPKKGITLVMDCE